MIKISIITPLYFGKNYIHRLILQAEKNTLLLKNAGVDIYIEYIFINDSPTEKISNFFIKSKILNNIKLIINERNVGIHQSRINGLKKSEGDYIHFLDQDDVIKDYFLFYMVKKINKADIVVCNGFRKTNQKLNKIYKTNIALFMVRFKRIYIYGTDMILSPGQCLIRKNAIPETWLKNVLSINGCDDFYLWLAYFSKKKYVRCMYRKLYIHSEHVDNFSKNKEKMNESFFELINFLRKNKTLSSKEIDILVARYNIKKSNNKMKLLIQNPLILLWTILYKIAGYY